jgi:peptide/nickel transport system substrate-binding protein
MRTVLSRAIVIACGLGTAIPVNAATLRVGLANDVDILDPTLLRTFASIQVLNAICDKLIDLTPDLRFVPQLATAWAWDENGKVLTLTLRSGVKFQDGEPLDAAAVKYSIDRHRTMPGTVFKSGLAAIANVEALDARTVKINLSSPLSGPLLARFVVSAGMIVSPKAAEAAGEKFGSKPVCAGPYRFVERVAQDHITLEKFADYWDKDRVHVDRITYRFVPDSSVRLANLQSGDLDLIEQVAPSDLATIHADERLKTASAVSLGYNRIYLNVGHGPRAKTAFAGDQRVRQAFDLAIDREAVTQVAFNGEFVPASSWIPPGSPYSLESVPPHRRDVAQAKALLAAAGRPHPTVELIFFNNPTAIQVGQMIQAMAREAGFDITLLPLESVSAIQAGEKGNFDAFMVGWPGYADPDINIYSLLSCGAPLSYSGYCNGEVDNLLNLARASSDLAERVKYYTRVHEIISVEEPHIFLYHFKWIWAHTSKLKGFIAHPDGLTRMMDLRLE